MSEVTEMKPRYDEWPLYTPDRETHWDLLNAVAAMYNQGYCKAAILTWFKRWDVDVSLLADTFRKYGCSSYELDYGDKRLKREDLEWLDNKILKLEASGNPTDDGIDHGVVPKTDNGVETAETGETTAEPEVVDAEAVEPTAEERTAQLVDDPLPVFKQMNTYTLMVAQGLNTALLITGQGGVGKSYNVGRILSAYGKKGKDYVVMKGKSSVSAMYKFLYDNYDKIVVFDDCDSVLQNTDGLNILKGVLDSSDVREVSWNTSGPQMCDTFGIESHEEIEKKLRRWSELHKGKEGIPTYFRFMGSCIFISNLSASDLQRNAAMAPLLTRCTTVDIQLEPSEVILKMSVALPHMKIFNTRGEDITSDELKQEVFDYISSEEFLNDPRIAGKKISFRLFNKAYMFRYAGLPNWKELSFCI